MNDILHTAPCGCKVVRNNGCGLHIEFCGLHSAAAEMWTTLKAVHLLAQDTREQLKKLLTPHANCDTIDSDRKTSAADE